MRLLFITPLVIFLLVIIIMLTRLIVVDSSAPSQLVGRKLPDFNLSNSLLTNNDLNGKYSLLNIFGSWCISCKIEHNFLMELKKNNTLPIYGIAWRDNIDKLSQYLAEHGNPYEKIGLDMAGKTIIALGVTGAPETFLIAPNGTILYHHTGPLNLDIFNNKILPLIR